MKKLLLVCCIVLGVSSLSRAQGGGRPPQKSPEETLTDWKTSLALTDAQSTKLLPILTAQKKSTDSLMTGMQAGGDRQTMMASFTTIRAKYTTQIKAVLTADQATKYDALMPARGNRGGGGGGGGGTPPPPTR